MVGFCGFCYTTGRFEALLRSDMAMRLIVTMICYDADDDVVDC